MGVRSLRDYLGAVVGPGRALTGEPIRPKVSYAEVTGYIPTAPVMTTAPDPLQQGAQSGLISSRPSLRWFQRFRAEQELTVSAGTFEQIIVGPSPRATYPRGRMTPDPQRSNIRVPSHVAYGSLFQS